MCAAPRPNNKLVYTPFLEIRRQAKKTFKCVSLLCETLGILFPQRRVLGDFFIMVCCHTNCAIHSKRWWNPVPGLGWVGSTAKQLSGLKPNGWFSHFVVGGVHIWMPCYSFLYPIRMAHMCALCVPTEITSASYKKGLPGEKTWSPSKKKLQTPEAPKTTGSQSKCPVAPVPLWLLSSEMLCLLIIGLPTVANFMCLGSIHF